jgi:hypothetical protein
MALTPRRLRLLVLPFALLVAASAASAGDDAKDWHVYVGEAVVDTLDGTVAEAFAAGSWVLKDEKWTIERQDAAAGKLVTGWKPIRHPLVKFAAGPSKVRVAVSLKSVGDGRTEVQVLGGIASQQELKGPLLPLAQNAGQHECKGYVKDLKERLAEERLSDGAPSGTARATSGKR